jgi:hypothetical protein
VPDVTDDRATAGRQAELQCKDCKYWYGAEDEEIGPCQIKHIRGDRAYLTHGMHECDEDEVRNAPRD